MGGVLSLDGGGRYPYRLTPHLDRERRSFSIRLPDQPSKEARFLIRLGDEVRELEFELPWTFEIAPAGAPKIAAPRTFALARGEAARGGEAGVMSWLEGDRQGRRLRAVEAPPRDPSWRSVDGGSMLVPASFTPTSKVPTFPLFAPFTHPESGTKASPPRQHPESALAGPEPRERTCRINE